MPTYAVTGTTGHLGRLVVENLLDRGAPASDVVAVVRDPAKAADLAARGVQVRQADYSRPETLLAALAGVDRLLLVSGNEVGQRVGQHTNVIEAARAAGVGRVVYTSILRADTTTNPLAPEHLATEQVLTASRVPFTVLRNGWYTENYTGQLGQYLERGEIVGATGAGRISGAARADYAEAAAVVLTGDGHTGAVYELGGAPFTLAELAETISEVTGTKVAYRDLSPTDYATALRGAGLDADTAAFVAAIDETIARGELETGSDDLARLTGRPTTPLVDVVQAARS